MILLYAIYAVYLVVLFRYNQSFFFFFSFFYSNDFFNYAFLCFSYVVIFITLSGHAILTLIIPIFVILTSNILTSNTNFIILFDAII